MAGLVCGVRPVFILRAMGGQRNNDGRHWGETVHERDWKCAVTGRRPRKCPGRSGAESGRGGDVWVPGAEHGQTAFRRRSPLRVT